MTERNAHVAEPFRTTLNAISQLVPPMRTVNPDISDLFFNYEADVDIALKDDNGDFMGYDDAKLRERALIFLGCLSRLNVATPSVDELVADFYGRV